MPYQIKNWNDHFENAKSRTILNKTWGNLPNKQDGLGYGLIMRQPDGAAIYGGFVAMVLMCSKQANPRNGWITEDGTPTGRALLPIEISIKTQVPESIIERVLEITSSAPVGWVEDTAGIPQGYREDTKYPPSSPIREGVEGEEGLENRGGKKGDHGSRDENLPDLGNPTILHKPEQAKKVKLQTFAHFMQADVTSIACTLADEFSGPGMGFFSKQLKALADRTSDAKACEIIRNNLFEFSAEIKAGETVDNPGKAINARIKKIMQQNGGIAQ